MSVEKKLSKNQEQTKDYLESFSKGPEDDAYKVRAMKAAKGQIFIYKGSSYIIDENGCMLNLLTKAWRNPFSPDLLSNFEIHKASESEIFKFVDDLKSESRNKKLSETDRIIDELNDTSEIEANVKEMIKDLKL